LERVQKLNVKTLPSRAAAPVRAVAPTPAVAPVRKAATESAAQAPAPRTPRRKVSSEGAGESIVYEEGKVLFNQGDKADHLAIILEGSVEIFDPKSGNSIAVLNKGVSFGEQAILEGGMRGASARAHTRVVCLEISTAPLRAILKSDPGILTPVVEAMLLQLNMANKISKSVATDDLDYEVTSDNNLSSTQVQKILDEVYATGDNKGMSSDELMFLKLLASNKLHSTVHEAGTVLGSPEDTELGLGYIIVQGHVDGTGTLVALTPGEQWMKCEVKVDRNLLKYIVAKGSICFSGVSLTVGEVHDETSVVTVWLIPETIERTSIATKKPGDLINIEVDVLAKYVERMMELKK
jgi:CRP-like cAMP-binding protein